MQKPSELHRAELKNKLHAKSTPPRFGVASGLDGELELPLAGD